MYVCMLCMYVMYVCTYVCMCVCMYLVGVTMYTWMTRISVGAGAMLFVIVRDVLSKAWITCTSRICLFVRICVCLTIAYHLQTDNGGSCWFVFRLYWVCVLIVSILMSVSVVYAFVMMFV